jgi:hypothetical protein
VESFSFFYPARLDPEREFRVFSLGSGRFFARESRYEARFFRGPVGFFQDIGGRFPRRNVSASFQPAAERRKGSP